MSGLVVAIHDVAPHRAGAARLWRGLVAQRAPGPVSLLVIPRYGDVGCWQGTDGLAWLRDRAAMGDEIVAHGLAHTTADGRDGPELARCDPLEVCRRVDEGARELARVGLTARGFIAPAYVHPSSATTARRRAGLTWWATRWRLHWDGPARWLPSITLGASTRARRWGSPPYARLALLETYSSDSVRLDLHTADLEHPALREAGLAALESLLEQGRALVTHADLVTGGARTAHALA